MWNPNQYEKFKEERSIPFFDLVSLIDPINSLSILDLGCGSGELTAQLHQKLNGKETLGIDSSPEMLQESVKYKVPSIKFENHKIEEFTPQKPYDLIFSNAALQWVPNHAKLFEKITSWLSKSGQLAIQLPANFDYPTHTVAYTLAKETPFAQLIPNNYKPCVLTIEEYATLLHTLGFKKMVVRQQVYPHLLDSTDSLIEWVKGSLLTAFKSHLPNGEYELFLKTYKKRLLSILGWSSPFFFPMKRILIWAKK